MDQPKLDFAQQQAHILSRSLQTPCIQSNLKKKQSWKKKTSQTCPARFCISKAAKIKVRAEQVPPKDNMKVEFGKDAKDTNEVVEEITVSSSPIPQLDSAFSEILSTNIE